MFRASAILGGSSNMKAFKRGYGYQGSGSRGDWEDVVQELSHGKDLKEAILKPGGWTFGMGGFGEVLPYEDNRMTLDYDKLDGWGLPTITFDAEFKENEWKMREDMKEQAYEMLTKAGLRDVETLTGQELLVWESMKWEPPGWGETPKHLSLMDIIRSMQ